MIKDLLYKLAAIPHLELDLEFDNQKMIDEYLEREGLRAESEQETPGLPDTEVSS